MTPDISSKLAHLHLATGRLTWLAGPGLDALIRWSELVAVSPAGDVGCMINGSMRRLRWWFSGDPVAVAAVGGAFWGGGAAEGAAEDLIGWADLAGATAARAWVEVAPIGVDSGWSVAGRLPLGAALEGEGAEASLRGWAAAQGVTEACGIGWSVRGLGGGPELEIVLPGKGASERLDRFEELVAALGVEGPSPRALARLEVAGADDISARLFLDADHVAGIGVVTEGAATNDVLVGLLDDMGFDTAERHAWFQGVVQTTHPFQIAVDAELEISYVVGD